MKKPQMVAMVDVSGSIPSRMLMAIESQLQIFAQTFDVVVMNFNTHVTDVYRFKKRIFCQGVGGGTNLKPAFAWMGRYYPKAVMVAVFTDGYVGESPMCAPEMPVFWYLTDKESQAPRRWGIEIPAHKWS